MGLRFFLRCSMAALALMGVACQSTSSVGPFVDTGGIPDPQCAGDAAPGFCKGKLVQCARSQECVALGAGTPVCFQGFCVECGTWQDCPARAVGCSSVSQACGSCTLGSDCPPGATCSTSTYHCSVGDAEVAHEAGTPRDAGRPRDAGMHDTAVPVESGPRDAGRDAKTTHDATTTDAKHPPDSAPVDAKAHDTAAPPDSGDGGRLDAADGG